MIIIRRITNEVDVGVCRGIHWLSALSASLYFLELRASSLDLTSSVLRFLNTRIVVRGSKVVISSQNRSSLLWIVLLFEQLTVLDRLTKSGLFFLHVSLIEAGRVFNHLWLLLLLNGIYITKWTHQAQVAELRNIFASKRCHAAGVSQFVKLFCNALMFRPLHQLVYFLTAVVVRWFHHTPIWDSLSGLYWKRRHRLNVELWLTRSIKT